MPYFSIIIPVYNVAPYLRECLDSVLAQTFTAWEAICVDDGSTDGSGAILDEYAAKDKRFRVIHQANAGVSAARNVAIGAVKGEWVGFLDADDVFRLNVLDVCREAVELFPAVDIIRFKLKEFAEHSYCDWPDMESLDSYRCLDFAIKISPAEYKGGFSTRFYKASKVKQIKFLPFVVGEDLAWLVRVMDGASSMVVINAVCYGYRQRSSSVTHQRISGRIVESEIMYAAEVLKIMAFSKKVYHKSLFRQYCNFEVEHVAYSLLSLHKHEFNNLKKLWKKKLIELSKYKTISLFHRMRMKVIGLFCWRIVILGLAQFPHWLKIKGFHR